MSDLIGHPLLTALGYALLHSVWIFGLLAAIAQLTARAFTDPARRHTVLLVVLAALPLVFLLLVWLGMPAASAALPDTSVGMEPFTLSAGPSAEGRSVREGWTQGLPMLAVAYLCGLLLAGGRTGWAYHRMAALRRGSLLPEPGRRTDYFSLRQTLAPGSWAEWRLSARVGEVLTVGIWRPMILFPLALVNELSPAEVDAILRHELAHLRRRDPLWQALQQYVATLFFYHPGVHWLCRSLDREREFACDDLAAGPSGRKTYARALLRVATYSLHPKIPFTVSATERSSFSHRVHRLFAPAAATSRRDGYLFAPLLSLPLFALLVFGTLAPPIDLGPDAIITGKVVDAATGEPLIGTAIMVKGTNTGTITDIDGAFRLDWSGEGEMTLSVNYVGYVSKEIVFDNVKDRDFTVELTKQQKEARGGGSGAGSEDLLFPNLSGDVILVVDGKVVDPEGLTLKPSQIEAVNVVKDKSKIAELGYDTAKEGVILITTKQQ
ncbi:M56 family metallopeptidase [Lewinella sp. IMCC34183]|uniref:M56 family metallopeptidase n=1 Tax=Lewinella sp. IMCC34183 TaxID=2248762 RepID=UPI000E25825B|nr:M56 family metallopeptidase [Lewinella sp. IMCC34183]